VNELDRFDDILVWVEGAYLLDLRFIDQRLLFKIGLNLLTYIFIMPFLVILDLDRPVGVPFEASFLWVSDINFLKVRDGSKKNADVLDCHLASFITDE